jgi:hypothetical protein
LTKRGFIFTIRPQFKRKILIMKILPIFTIWVSVSFSVVPASAEDFSFGFSWDGLKKCTSGNPNSVSNPAFTLKNVPDGTTKIKFTMVDLAVPSYYHGGGTAIYSGASTVEPGAFKYKSPCPPDGKHTYQWTAVAVGGTGKKLATAKSKKSYP